MLYDRDLLEQAKQLAGFDEYVSQLIVSWRQSRPLDLQAVTVQVKRRFNENKMNALTGDPLPPVGPPRRGWSRKYVAFRTHDGLNSISMRVMEHYFRLANQPVPPRQDLQSAAVRLKGVLGEAVVTIPVSQVQKSR